MRLLASIDPRFWEVILPRPGEVNRNDRTSPRVHLDASDPKRSDFQYQVQLAARDLTRRIADAAAATSAQGGDGAAVIRGTVDEWAIVDQADSAGRVPLKQFFPRLWWVDLPGPRPPDDSVDLIPALAAAAWSFLFIAATIEDASLNEAIHTAVGTILGAAERVACG